MIAIKDVKLPVDCQSCFARFGSWCHLDLDERMVVPALPEESVNGFKPEWCPLVEFPDEAGSCSEVPNNSDCISRRDALALWDKYHYSIAIHAMEYDEELRSLPSVQPIKPERKKGKWLLSDEQRREDTDNGNYLYFCSNCLRSDVHAKTQEVPYCWWCGADMRGELNE